MKNAIEDKRKELYYLRRFKGVIWREMNGYKKHTTRVWAVGRTHYRSLPMKHVFSSGSCPKQKVEYQKITTRANKGKVRKSKVCNLKDLIPE